MKHGMAFRKFSRSTSHRNMMLRNLVTSLFEHEQIQTTLPKARDAARLAEKIITLGKRGTPAAVQKATAFLLNRDLVPKLFTTFAERYAERPGGYTRIHKYGNRFGDNAPNAVLELVDNPQDLRWHITARSVGWELVKEELKNSKPLDIIQEGVTNAREVIEAEQQLKYKQPGLLRPKTRWNLQKVLKYRGPEGKDELSEAAAEYADTVLAQTVASDALSGTREFRAGHMPAGETRNALHLAKGITGHQKPAPSASQILTVRRMFKRMGK